MFCGSLPFLGVQPSSGIIAAPDGSLHGVCAAGGSPANYGAAFMLRPDGTSRRLIHIMGGADGADPGAGLIAGVDGNLYGTTDRTIFTVRRDGAYHILYHTITNITAGGNPYGRMAASGDGTLYGTMYAGGANGAGTIFAIKSDGSGFHVLHDFGNGPQDGNAPYAGLTMGSDGLLYGVTSYGGTNGSSGTLFKLRPDGNGYAVLHQFGYGYDGYSPTAALVEGKDGALYGTTLASGGGRFGGTIFKLNKDGSDYARIHDFDRAASGALVLPSALLLGADGSLYGTTALGGITNASLTNGAGLVFKISADGADFNVVHTFDGEDGRFPSGGLAVGPDGGLYGTTQFGGYRDLGTVYKLSFSPPTTAAIIDFRFDETNGVSLTLSGAPSQSWTIQGAADIGGGGGWESVGSASTDANGLFQFTDAAATRQPYRFYRTVTP
jgi:uncharacterized repeat protein (TIGR03803 family)